MNVFLARFQQLPCKHGVEVMLAQRCFSVVTLKQLSIKAEFQPPEFAGYFNTHIYKYRVHYVTSCKIHLKIRKQLMKTAPWKKLFLNCVNINI